MKKEKIFSKFNTRNYNEELEEVLDKKDFSENVKNDILNIIYKIEEAYNDYEIVKKEVLNEKDFLEKILKSITEYCNSIEILTSDKIKAKKYILDYEKGKIQVSSDNVYILFAILKMMQKSKKYYNEADIIEKKPIYDFLRIGYNINNIEVIRDFNGWSWVISSQGIENIKANLIYQNLQILLGNRYMEYFMQNVMIKENDFIEILKKQLKKIYEGEIAEKIVDELKKVSLIEISKIDTEYKKVLLEIRQRKQEEFNLMENKKEYLKEITYIKKTNNEIIKGIDKTINNRELLQVEYKLRNSMRKNNEKIFSISYLVDILNEERKEALEKIAEINTLMEPKTYIRKKEEIKSIIDDLSENQNDNNILEIQKLFIKCILSKVNTISEKSDIINNLIKVRYYMNLLYNNNQQIKDIEDIQIDLKELQEKMLEKLLDNKLVFKFCDDNEFNKKIVFSVLNTKIINLETIYIKITDNKDKLKLEIYDEENDLDTVEYLLIDNTKCKNLKLDKKIKLFL